MSRTGPNRAVVNVVLTRSDHHCERCGRARPDQIHHRKPRGAGGTSDPAINFPSNLLALCTMCHLEVERDRSVSYEQGWLVRREHDPALSKVWIVGKGFVLLTDVGGMTDVEAA